MVLYSEIGAAVTYFELQTIVAQMRRGLDTTGLRGKEWVFLPNGRAILDRWDPEVGPPRAADI
jgi:hypothetical protein